MARKKAQEQKLPDLQPGMPVKFVEEVPDKDAHIVLSALRRMHGNKKITVRNVVDKKHVSIQDEHGELLRLVSTHDAFLLNVCFLEPRL